MKKFAVKLIAAVVIGSVLYFVLGRFLTISTPIPNVTISLQIGFLAFAAAVFGPIAGCLTGLIGQALIDFVDGGGIWLNWILAAAFFGLFVGCFKKFYGISEGTFGRKGIVRFNIIQLIGCIIAWVSIAPILAVVMYEEPAAKSFLQGFGTGVSNFIIAAVIGTILCFVFSAVKPKKKDDPKEPETTADENLSKEE